MKQRMIERMSNFAGNPRPVLAQRVWVQLPGATENDTRQAVDIFPAHPNKPLRIERVES